MTERSETIEKLAEALAAAQGEMEGARKDAENPHFKSRYADLASIWDACRAPLSTHGLAVVQTTRLGEAGGLSLVTTLLHTSGQWVAGEMPIMADPRNPQSLGSWTTYVRRYALAAIVGIAPEDDDGESAAAPARDRREPDRRREGPEAPARDQEAESWSHYISGRLRKLNGEWLREMAREGIEPAVRQEHKELTCEPRTVNHLCSRLIELGKLDKASVGKSGNPEVRDPAKARDAVKWFFDNSPNAIKRGVEKYLKKKLSEARVKLGMPDLDEDETPGTPPPGKGDAYEGDLAPSTERAGAC